MARHRFVLAIDGGGIRGIIPAMLLDHLETATGRPSSDLFDLMVGTSTGGIIALGLSQPCHELAHTPRHTARDLAMLYAARGGDIFSRTLWRRIRSLRGLLDESYDTEPLERALRDYFGNAVLGDSRCPVMVTAYDIEHRHTLFLKSFKPSHADMPMVAAARATSAAPTYFEPTAAEIEGRARALIDGGVYINSPAVSAYAEALKRFPNDIIHVVSLGTGELTRPIPLEKAAGWGSAGWVMPLLDCMFDGVSKVADHQMRLFLGERYHRFQLSLEHANDDMDDATDTNIAALFKSASLLIERESERLDALAEQLTSLRRVSAPHHLQLDPAVF